MRCTALGLATVLASSAVAAAPVAAIREDIDGNGTPDDIALSADGVLAVGSTTVKIAPAVTKARLAVARGVQVVADITTGQTREGVVVERGKIVARFPLGGVGLDREYGVEVDATATGVYRYQTRWDVRRCDDKPAYLFGERLDGTVFKKLDKLPAQLPDATTTLPARLDPATASAPLIFQAKAASHQPGATDAGGLAIPRELDDGRADTGWREDLASHGEGQFFTFKARIEGARAHQLRIVPGNPTSQAAMRAAGRPRAMAIVTKQGAWRFELPDAANEVLGAAYVVELPQGSDCVTVVLETAHGNGATAIAELGIYADGERAGGAEALFAKVVAEGKSGATNAAAALARRGAAGARAIDAELAATRDVAVRRRLITALAKIQDPAAVASLVRAASEGWVRDKDLLDVIGALAANGRSDALRDLAAKSGLPLEIRVAAAKRISASGGGLAILVELAGTGPRELRREVIERLAGAPIDALAQAAIAQTTPAAAGDLWRAVTRSARHEPSKRATAVAAMTAALPTTTDYERRYRLVDGIATHGDAAALAALDTLLRGLPAGPHAAALRQVAIRGITSAPRVEAVALVIGLASDPDPGVRLAMLSAIANTESDAAGVWHGAGGPDAIDRVIITAMADTWPEVRRRAATALGGRCQRTGPAQALFQAVGADRALEVRQDAVSSLVQCRATGVGQLLAQTWDSSKQPLELREHAVKQVVALGDKQLAATLVGRFTRWRGQAIESREAMVLAQAAASTIGTLAPPGAAVALMAALDDSAFPEIVASAALALGALGPACPAAAKAKLTELARSDDQSSTAARRGAAMCGRAR